MQVCGEGVHVRMCAMSTIKPAAQFSKNLVWT